MKKNRYILLCLSLPVYLFAREYQSEETTNNQYVFKGADQEKTLIVKNYYGDIHVSGHSQKTVDVIIHKKIQARSKEQFEKANTEVVLDILEEEDLIEFYVDGPFRDRNNKNSWHPDRYTVTYHFKIILPFETLVDLETINEGEIVVENIKGKCSAKNINGGIQASGIQDIGKIYALNKDVNLQFDRNPAFDCIVGSLNGDVRLVCPENFSADFTIKTFNGDVYSDFQTERIPGKPFLKMETNGKNVYKTGHHARIRIHKGGPLIQWDGFNGDLLIINGNLNKQASR